MSIEFIKKELLKCRLLCSYCHMIKTKLQKKEKKEYYKSLTEPLKSKSKKKNAKPPRFSNEEIKEMRRLFNEENNTTLSLSIKYNIAESMIYKIVDNAIYIDKSYKRTRPRRNKYPELSQEDADEIYRLWNIKPRPFTSKQIQEKFNCGKGIFGKIVYSKK